MLRLGYIVAVLVFFTLIFLNLSILSISSSTVEGGDVDVKISVMGNKELNKFGRKVFIMGVWNWVNLSFRSNTDRIEIALYKGDSIPVNKNSNNYYSWSYDNGWNSLSIYNGNGYLDKENCKKVGNNFSFRVTTDSLVKEDFDNWTLSVNNDEMKIPVILESPIRDLAVTSADYNLRVDPFQEDIIYVDHNFITINNGNLPIRVNVSYDMFGDRITTSNMEKLLYPNETLEHSIKIKTLSWRPGRIQIKGAIEGLVPSSIIPSFIESQPTIQLNTAYMASPFPFIMLVVGHSNYEIKEIKNSDITFQYKKEIKMSYGEIENITYYLCGNGEINMSIYGENITILNIKIGNNTVENISKFNVQSTNRSEVPITIQLDATRPNTTGYVFYTIWFNNHVYNYSTAISIGPKVYKPKENESYVSTYLLVSIGFALTFAYILYSQFKHRR